MGSAVLKDHTARELNLDGTPKVAYRYPNNGSARQQQPAHINCEELVEDEQEEGSVRRYRPATQDEQQECFDN